MELVCFNESTDCNSNAQPVISQPHHKKPQICRRTGKKDKKNGKIENKKKHAFRHMNLEEEKQVLRASHPQVRSPTYPHHRNG